METRITDGRINLKGNLVFREKPKHAHYIMAYQSIQQDFALFEKIHKIIFSKDDPETITSHEVYFSLYQ